MHARRKYPLPEYAKNLDINDITWSYPWMVFIRPVFVVFAVALYVFGVYFPWSVVSDWVALRAFAWTMTQIIPSIEGLPSKARHLPHEASLIQLGVLHFACGAFFLWRLITLKPAVWLLQPGWRFVLMAGACAVGMLPTTYWIFVWRGTLSDLGLQSMHELVGLGVFALWFMLTVFASLGLSSFYELGRRRRCGKV